jgi:DNA-binding NarL/FixJ family response regulator
VETPIRLLIVDDHTLFREGIKALLSTTTDVEVVGEASDGAGVLEQVSDLRPNVVLMDINMPELNGIDATRVIHHLDPTVGVIMLTMLEDDASVFAAMRAGARGYLLKGANPHEMLEVIRAVADGQALFGPAIAVRITRFFQEMNIASSALEPQKNQFSEDDMLSELSDREREVLEWIAAGYNNSEIARKLVISPNTVRNHITSIFSKLQAADRAKLIVMAKKAGLGEERKLQS